MSVAIIISTHGVAAKQLLMTAEMLIGEQQNVAYIDFVPGENADILIEKYNQKLNELDVSQGVLFLVDMWEAVHLTPLVALSKVKIKTNMI